MTTVANELRSICTQLLPFFASVAAYFYLLIPYENPSALAVIIKCTPIASLMHFVVTVGFRNGYNAYTARILAGLIFCCLGDGLLLFNPTFLHGMVAFIIGHINYIWAFGFIPLRLWLGVLIFSLGGIAVSLMYAGLRGVMVYGVPIYILVINTMVWRAIARVQSSWSWIQMSTCFGSILFAISDLMIGVDRFIQPVYYSQVLIMSTYYAAQLGVSLSVVESS